MVSNGRRAVALSMWIAAVGLVSLSVPLSAQSQHYKQTNLVSDTPGVATFTDPVP